MAKRDTKAPQQPAEDMFGRPTSTKNKGADGPSREAQGTPKLPQEAPETREAHPHEEEDEAEREKAYGGVGELPDGDGVRSDRGTNPLPTHYWAAYPDSKPGSN